MPPPRVFHPRQAEREAEFKAARSRAEVDMLLKAWSDEDRQAEYQTEQRGRLDDIERRTNHDRLEDLVARVKAVEGSLLPGGDFFDQLVEALGDHIGQIRRRLDALESSQWKFAGVHEPGKTYSKNGLVVRSGSLWIALDTTANTPGSGENSGWVMVVKRGSAASADRQPVVA
jgi:hypothetical protein